MARSKNQLSITFKAGDCRYYRTKHPDIGESWEEQGLLEFAHAPREFQPDYAKLASAPGLLGQLADVLRHYDESQLRILMAALHDSFKLRAVDLKFGQPVYKNLSAPYVDYIDCWYRAYVIALGPMIDGTQFIYITGSLDDINGTLLMVPAQSVMTRAAFVKHRKELARAGLTKSPTKERYRLIRHSIKSKNVDEFPSITEVADRLTDIDAPTGKRASNTSKKRGRSTFNVDIV